MLFYYLFGYFLDSKAALRYIACLKLDEHLTQEYIEGIQGELQLLSWQVHAILPCEPIRKGATITIKMPSVMLEEELEYFLDIERKCLGIFPVRMLNAPDLFLVYSHHTPDVFSIRKKGTQKCSPKIELV